MVSVPRWWLARSRAERFDISLRWPLYGICCAEIPIAALAIFSERQHRVLGVVVFLLVVVAHTAANLYLLRESLGRYLHGKQVSSRALIGPIALAVAGVPAAALAFPRFAWIGDSDLRDGVILVLAGGLTFALTPMLRWMSLFGVMLAGSVLTAALAVRVEPGFAYLSTVAFIAFTCRISAWTLGLGWEIDRSRAVSAQLAIAEERLRFARDLHDTLGHNLSLVAVRSELAAALATRGDATAADQMLDVRQIAHDSLREMRAVVSGYRATDLATELAGAQSVLRSAGVNCRIIGDGSALTPASQTALGWVVREGTTNVIQHSDATVCKIELDLSPELTILRMENDGVRTASSSAASSSAVDSSTTATARSTGGGSSGTGIAGLRERLGSLGGTLTVGSTPGRFILVVQLPAST
ncbi:histidine kinase [Kribbella koreensis]|uniref:Histidine kinase n=1 Tax=Kribbella koreensis TaxID=57909 RepID=A0ABP4BMB6_9ACTN